MSSIRIPGRASGRASASSVVAILSSRERGKSVAAGVSGVCRPLRPVLEAAYLPPLLLVTRATALGKNLASIYPVPQSGRGRRSRRGIVGPLLGARRRGAGSVDPLRGGVGPGRVEPCRRRAEEQPARHSPLARCARLSRAQPRALSARAALVPAPPPPAGGGPGFHPGGAGGWGSAPAGPRGPGSGVG